LFIIYYLLFVYCLFIVSGKNSRRVLLKINW
jgi:hypothetical protein